MLEMQVTYILSLFILPCSFFFYDSYDYFPHRLFNIDFNVMTMYMISINFDYNK